MTRRDDRREAELKATGTARPYEKEYFQKSDSRVPVLVGATTFEGRQDEGVAFVLDWTDRKRAEAAALESERRYHQVEMELAHASRVTRLGQLSASIGHEINQPIAAVVTEADAALRWLGARPPGLDEVREALDRIVKNGKRATSSAGSAFIKKSRHGRIAWKSTKRSSTLLPWPAPKR
jgi:C4-dicarboxylate-specific signal transduction histidine kinase